MLPQNIIFHQFNFSQKKLVEILICAQSAQLHLVWLVLRKREYCIARSRTKKYDFGGFCMLDFIFYIFDRSSR